MCDRNDSNNTTYNPVRLAEISIAVPVVATNTRRRAYDIVREILVLSNWRSTSVDADGSACLCQDVP